jgi:hypothetical protein
MFTFKNVFAVGLFLFGTTFVWMTASFAGKTPPPTGAAWSLENVLALVAVVGFSVAAWGVFKDLSWWEPVAIVSAIVGLIAVIPYTVGLSASDIGYADSGVQINLALHAVGSGLVLLLIWVPAMRDALTTRLH